MDYNEWHSLMVGIILKVIPKWHERRKNISRNFTIKCMCTWTGILTVLHMYMYILYEYLHLRTPFQFYNLLVLCEIFFTRRMRLVTKNESFTIILFIIFRLIWLNRRTGVALTRSKQCHEQNNIISHIRW